MDIKRITCVENLKDNFFVDTWGNLYKEENCELVKMKLYRNPENGYEYKNFTLTNGEIKTVRWHRIVATMFIPNDDPLKVYVNHIDGNPANNCVDNLEWCTPSENSLHALRMGLALNRKKCDPLRLDIYDMAGNLLHHDVSESEASRILGCTRGAISEARKHRHGCLPKLKLRVKRCDLKSITDVE